MKMQVQPNQPILNGLRAALLLAVLLLPRFGQAQGIDPRRRSHLPIGASFAGAGYAYITGENSQRRVKPGKTG